MTADALRERIADRLFGQIHGQGITSPLLLADAVLDALGLEQIGGVAYCVMHDEMDIEGYDPMGECRRSDGCVVVPVYARTEETPSEESGMSRSIEQSPREAYEALIESIMKNADPDHWDSGSDTEAVAYVRFLEDEVERLRRVCLRRARRTWVDGFDEEGDRG